MSEIVIRVNLNWDGRWARAGRCLMAGAMFFATVPELASESVTLTTYYPAPSGVYTQMIATGNTYLARDAASNGGQVVIGGGAVSGTGHELDVYSYMGSANNSAIRATYPGGGGLAGTEFGALANRNTATYGARWAASYSNAGTFQNGYVPFGGAFAQINNGAIGGAYGLIPDYATWNQYGTGAGGAAIYNDNVGYRTLMLVGNNSAGGVRQVSVWDQLTVNGSLNVTSDANISGKALVTGATYMGGGSYTPLSNVTYASGACYFTTYVAGANQIICPASWFVTLTGGYMSKYTVVSNSMEPQGDALCCPCPAGLNVGYVNGCPAL